MANEMHVSVVSIVCCLLMCLPLADSSFDVRHTKDVKTWTRGQDGNQLWNTEKKWFFCVSAKTACSEWLSYIYAQSLPKEEAAKRSEGPSVYSDISYPELSLYKRHRGTGNHSLCQAQIREIERISADPSYFRVAIARHPWDRLVSGFRSKMEGKCKFGNDCVREMLGWAPPEGQKITFSEFVEYLARGKHSGRMDNHFALASDLCGLEYMNYTFVGDLHEPEDLAYVSKKLGFTTSFTEYSIGPYVHDAPDHAKLKGAKQSGAFPCDSETVINAIKYLEPDARTLGVNFTAALHSCTTYGMTSPPQES